MKSTKLILLIFWTVSSCVLLKAQEENNSSYLRFSLKLNLGNHAVGFPFENTFSTFNPYGSIGTELRLNRSSKHRLFLATNLGVVRNQIIGNSVNLDCDLGYRYTSGFGIYGEMAPSIGIMNQFHPADIYEQRSDGSYAKVNDTGFFASTIGLKLGAGYDLSQRTAIPITLGIHHNFYLQTSYFDVASFPIMPQSTTNISITYKFERR